MEDHIILRCVKEGNKLRIKVVSPGYSQHANCQFPKDIRVENCEYTVPKSDCVMANTKNKFFYRIKKNNIKILKPSLIPADFKVYGEEELHECAVCMTNLEDQPSLKFVILVKCGHYALCEACAHHCFINSNTCPLCRTKIDQIITKEDLQ